MAGFQIPRREKPRDGSAAAIRELVNLAAVFVPTATIVGAGVGSATDPLAGFAAAAAIMVLGLAYFVTAAVLAAVRGQQENERARIESEAGPVPNATLQALPDPPGELRGERSGTP